MNNATLTIYLDNGKYRVKEKEPICASLKGTLEVYPPDGTGKTPIGCILRFDEPFKGQKCWSLSDPKKFDMTDQTECTTYTFDILDPCNEHRKEKMELGAHSIQIGN
jgi:hypothetical protein